MAMAMAMAMLQLFVPTVLQNLPDYSRSFPTLRFRRFPQLPRISTIPRLHVFIVLEYLHVFQLVLTHLLTVGYIHVSFVAGNC